jgi:general secretion pathway protein K
LNKTRANRIWGNQKGAALVVTLAIVAILLAAALQLGKFTGDSVMKTLMEKERFQAEQLALSGINLGIMILVDDAAKTDVDSVQEPWADPDLLLQAVNELGLEQNDLTIKITDELSKLQVNALLSEFPGYQVNPDQLRIWEHFLGLKISADKTEDQRDPQAIINSVIDWLDSNDDDAVTGISGAESDYYQDLDPPYACTNGPFHHINEILNVKGISNDLLQEEDPDQDPDPDQTPGQNPDQNQDENQTMTTKSRLNDFFTVYGMDEEKTQKKGSQYTGKVNINTAGLDVIEALLPEGMEAFAQDLIDFREHKSEDTNTFINLLDRGWYKRVIPLPQTEQERFDRGVRYASHVFQIKCEAEKNNTRVTLTAIVKREKHKTSGAWHCRILQMERE